MVKLLLYCDKGELTTPDSSTGYLYRTIIKDNRFQVDFCYDENPELSKDYDGVLCRFDIPVRNNFLMELHKYHLNSDTLFINPPLVKLNLHKKSYLKEFIGQDILPKTFFSSDYQKLASFAKNYSGKLVSKPLDENGGKGIRFFDSSKMTIGELEQLSYDVTHQGNKEIMYQAFVDGIETLGDKRINIFFYDPVSAVLSLPSKGSFMCNIKSGGHLQKTEITKSDYKVIERIMPFLKEHNIVWAGIDIIGPYLGEINKESPGLLWGADNMNENSKSVDALINKIWRHFE